MCSQVISRAHLVGTGPGQPMEPEVPCLGCPAVRGGLTGGHVPSAIHLQAGSGGCGRTHRVYVGEEPSRCRSSSVELEEAVKGLKLP